jgi:hypothetical protein
MCLCEREIQVCISNNTLERGRAIAQPLSRLFLAVEARIPMVIHVEFAAVSRTLPFAPVSYNFTNSANSLMYHLVDGLAGCSSTGA